MLSAKTRDSRPALSSLQRELVRVKERLRNISNKLRLSLWLNRKHKKEFSHCTIHIPYYLQWHLMPPVTPVIILGSWSRFFSFFCARSKWLTICLRNAIREFLDDLRSSLLSLTSVGSGVAAPSSLRSTVCKAEATSSDFITSTGDSHTTWIILPRNKTVKKTQKTFLQNTFYEVGSWLPLCPHICYRFESMTISTEAHLQDGPFVSWNVLSNSQFLNNCQIDWPGSGEIPALWRHKA